MDKLDIKDIDQKLLEEMKQLVLARIKAASDNLEVSLGSQKYTKEEILKSVQKGDDLGLEIIDIQMEFLRDLASGEIYVQANE